MTPSTRPFRFEAETGDGLPRGASRPERARHLPYLGLQVLWPSPSSKPGKNPSETTGAATLSALKIVTHNSTRVVYTCYHMPDDIASQGSYVRRSTPRCRCSPWRRRRASAEASI